MKLLNEGGPVLYRYELQTGSDLDSYSLPPLRPALRFRDPEYHVLRHDAHLWGVLQSRFNNAVLTPFNAVLTLLYRCVNAVSTRF